MFRARITSIYIRIACTCGDRKTSRSQCLRTGWYEMKTRLPYLKTWMHKPSGKVYARFRRKVYEQIQLPGVFGSDEMMAAYWAVRNCGTPSPIDTSSIGASRLKPGTIASVVALFLQSSSFTSDSAGTQRRRRSQ